MLRIDEGLLDKNWRPSQKTVVETKVSLREKVAELNRKVGTPVILTQRAVINKTHNFKTNSMRTMYFYSSVHLRLTARHLSSIPESCRTWCSGYICVLSCLALIYNQHHENDINSIFQLPHLGAPQVCGLALRTLGPAFDSILLVRRQLLRTPYQPFLLPSERYSSSL